MRKFQVLSLVLSLTLAGAARAQDELPRPAQTATATASQEAPSPSDHSQQQLLGYALGFNIGGNLRNNGADVDLKSLMAGISDGLRGIPPTLPEDKLAAAVEQFQQQLERRAIEQMKQLGDINKRKADAFLAQNSKREGVQETASGLQYKVLGQGSGPSPALTDTVRCHYRGTFMDGTEFDSSYRRGQPAEFAVDGVIAGWTEALQKMRVGDKWQLYVPPDLAYGAQPPSPAIEPNSLLIFEVELLDIVKQ